MAKAHEVDYNVFGDDIQYVEVELDPRETVIAESGSMMFMDSGIQFETKMGDGSSTDGSGLFGALKKGAKRALTGESVFMTHFTNHGQGKQRVAFAAPYPGKIIAIDLDETNGELICQRDAFLAAALGTSIDVVFKQKLGTGIFGGEGFILQRLKGDGMTFIHAGGTITEERLNGNKLLVDTGCIVAFEKGISYDIERVKGMKSMLFGGEGMFLATLEGHGRVWLQSMPFSRLAQRVVSMSGIGSGGSGGESNIAGSVIGSIFD